MRKILFKYLKATPMIFGVWDGCDLELFCFFFFQNKKGNEGNALKFYPKCCYEISLESPIETHMHTPPKSCSNCSCMATWQKHAYQNKKMRYIYIKFTIII